MASEQTAGPKKRGVNAPSGRRSEAAGEPMASSILDDEDRLPQQKSKELRSSSAVFGHREAKSGW